MSDSEVTGGAPQSTAAVQESEAKKPDAAAQDGEEKAAQPNPNARVETRRERLEKAYDEAQEKLAKEEPKAATDKPEAEAKEAKTEKAETANDAGNDIKAPQSWSNYDRRFWKDLPKETKEIISRRETERDRAIQEATTARAQLEKKVAPYAELEQEIADRSRAASKIEGKKVTPTEYMRTLARIDAEAAKSPVAYVKNFMSRYGIDAKALADGDDLAFDEEMHRERLARTQAEIAAEAKAEELQELREKLAEIERRQQEQESKQKLAPIETLVANFIEGKPKAESDAVTPVLDHFVDLAQRLGKGSSPTEVLDAAWNMATNALGVDTQRASTNGTAHATNTQSREIAGALRRAQGVVSTPPSSTRQAYANRREMLSAKIDEVLRSKR